MIDELNKRIIEVMVRTGHSKSSFAHALNVSLPIITHISSGRNKPGLDIIQKLLKHFEEISPDWLLLGKGPMNREKPRQPDFNPVLRELDMISVEIHGIEQSQARIVQYHKMLADEMLHLKELDQSVMVDVQKLEHMKKKIAEIKERLKYE